MAESVRVRMYNVGFGDCFLLEFPRPERPPFRVLIDCGAHTAGYPRPGWRPETAVDQILTDTVDGGSSAIDVVVATHRHQDHVSGFRSLSWAGVRVGEVWMPWTEDPQDPLATEIRERQSRLALGLSQAFASPGFAARWLNPAAATSAKELALNSLTNEAAMRTLHHGFSGRPTRRFLSSVEVPRIVPDDCPGLIVHVLGPSRDPEVIRDMDPPSGQSYLRFEPAARAPESAERSDAVQAGAQRPFARNFSLAPARFEAEPDLPRLDPAIKEAAASMMRGDDVAVAVALDAAVNGTSLMLMFEFNDAYLLFPGDAQWGTWNAALGDAHARDLLARTTFYKVGHHGSHNATPSAFVSDVLSQATPMWGAAVSVYPVAFWPEIPRGPLLEAVSGRTGRLVRSDRPGRSRAGHRVRSGGVGVDFDVPS